MPNALQELPACALLLFLDGGCKGTTKTHSFQQNTFTRQILKVKPPNNQSIARREKYRPYSLGLQC